MIADLSNARISYNDVGEGEPVIMISGFASTKAYWSKAPECLPGFRVISFDNRGVGETEYTDSFDFDDLVNDVAELMDHLGIEKAHVVGWSMGSLIARGFVSKYPERVLDLTIAASYIRRPARAWSLLRKFSNLLYEGKANSDDFYEMINAMTFSEKSFRRFEDAGKEVPVPTPIKDRMGLAMQLDAIDFIETPPELVNISCPVLIIHGTDDRTVPYEESKKLDEAIEGSRLHLLEGEGHNIPMTIYADVLKQFIEEHPASG